jgi:preprotein translocase subunit SecF
MLDIVGKRFWFLIITCVIVLVCIVSLGALGLKPGIEFSSGSLMTISFEQNDVSSEELKEELYGLGYNSAIVQTTGDGDFIVRVTELSAEKKTELKETLAAEFGDFEEKGFENVDPVIARQTSRTAGIAVAVAAVGILLYVTWAFRRMPSPFRYGACAIIALIHDALLCLGFFSIHGAVMDWEINLMFITGILAVIGYSVNNTVVVFDRIRENLTKGVSRDFKVVVNTSLVETLSRSLNTSVTTLIVVVALLLFIGSTIQNFAVVLLLGIIVGTYSSLCLAPQLLIVWENKEWRRIFRLGRAE